MLSDTFLQLAVQIIFLNIFLALFNLVPIPPLDGSKILPKFLPFSLAIKYEGIRQYMERNIGMSFVIVIVAFMLFLGGPLAALTQMITALMLGA